MTLSQTGIHSGVDDVTHLVSGSSTFQSIVGVGSKAEAYAQENKKIYRDEAGETNADGELQDLEPPFAIVYGDDDHNSEEIGIGVFRVTGTVRVEFIFPIPKEYTDEKIVTHHDRVAYMRIVCGAILSEMQALMRTGEPKTGLSYAHFSRASVDVLDIGEEEEMGFAKEDPGFSGYTGFMRYSLAMD